MLETQSLQTEKIESFKAGISGGLSTSTLFVLSVWLHGAIASHSPFALAPLPTTLLDSNGLVSAMGAGITGFLFGVTYRYILRQDQNSHLKSGAVLAFGLVRGLAQMDLGLTLEGIPWAIALLAVESLLMVAIARLTLDTAMERGWVKPLGGRMRDEG